MNEYLGKIITFLFGSSLRRIYLVIVFRSLIKLQWFCLIQLRLLFRSAAVLLLFLNFCWNFFEV